MDFDTYFLPVLIGLYLILILSLVTVAIRRKRSLESYSVGTKTIKPFWVGLSLAANLVSVATFVINPGLIYLYGVSGFWGYGVASLTGILISLAVVTKIFRRIGDETKALTLPQWIGARFGDEGLRTYFAVISFLLITFIVMICVGLTQVLSRNLGLSPELVMASFMILIFTYILLGGAVAHTLTNSLQGIIMIVAAIIMLSTAIPWLREGLGGILTHLAAIDPQLAVPINTDSLLFRSFFEVFICNFVVGIAVIMQPHIMSKALYLRSEKDVNIYLITAGLATTLFFMLIGVGLIARLELNPAGLVAPDAAIATFLQSSAFSTVTRAIVVVGILCSSISTLEGLLVAVSSIASNDLALPLIARTSGKQLSDVTEADKRRALNIGRVVLILVGFVAFYFSIKQFYNPSLSVAIFAQNGVYGLFAATFVPVIFGAFLPGVRISVIWAASITALVVHFGMYYGEITMYHNNPAVTVTFALFASIAVGLIMFLMAKKVVVPVTDKEVL